MKIGTGTPTETGVYCAQVYYGWKLLEWKHDAWYLESGFVTWAAGDPVQWIGPMPALLPRELPKPKLEFDL